jgi:hypothetical protein
LSQGQENTQAADCAVRHRRGIEVTGLAVAPLLLENDDAAPHTSGRPDPTNARNRCFQMLLDPIPVLRPGMLEHISRVATVAIQTFLAADLGFAPDACGENWCTEMLRRPS